MEQQQISPKKQKALDKVKRANAELAKVVREEKEQLRKVQDRHKYIMNFAVFYTNKSEMPQKPHKIAFFDRAYIDFRLTF